MPDRRNNRRQFLSNTARSAAGIAVPYIFMPELANAKAAISKNDRIKLGLIGAGGMGRGNAAAASLWCDVLAIADADSGRAAIANEKLCSGKADTHIDYRKVLDRTDLDAILIATPDHWHTKPLVEALQAGFDVYCEKPLTLTIDEGKLIRRVVEKTGRIVQVGTQQRSAFPLFVKAIAIVADDRLGRIKRVQAAIGEAPTSPSIPKISVPQELDWDRWLGPAPLTDYRWKKVNKDSGRNHDFTNCHSDFRWWYDFSGGKLTDWGAHHVDIAMWALRTNGQNGGLISMEGQATHPVPFQDGYPTENDRFNTATNFLLKGAFPGDTELIIRDDTQNGVLIEGEKGRIFVNRGKLTGKPVEDLKDNPLPEDALQKAYKGFPIPEDLRGKQAHWENFLRCIRERKQPISDVNSHMDALNVCHLAGISARLDRSLNWDSEAEQIVGDEQANAFLSRPYRSGYEIEM